jgi:PilZ domain-containing protein
MAKTVEHQGYKIESAPHHLVDGEQWQLFILISVEDDRGVRTRTFSPEGLYATEQEADIHGITFGQRLIDGKVEGRSVTDMKTTDRRAMPRVRVQFRTTFADATKLEGTGLMLDLSTGGCRIESPVSVEPGMSLELRIYAPDIEWPLMVEAASVQWVSGQTFGLAFFRITEPEQERLGQVVSDLLESESMAG